MRERVLARSNVTLHLFLNARSMSLIVENAQPCLGLHTQGLVFRSTMHLQPFNLRPTMIAERQHLANGAMLMPMQAQAHDGRTVLSCSSAPVNAASPSTLHQLFVRMYTLPAPM